MEYEIVHLPKEQWKGKILPIRYETDRYYDVFVDKTEAGFSVAIEKKSFPEPVKHAPEEYDFPDRLYADHWENAYAWGVLDGGELIAAMETERELWSNRLRITELWINEGYRKQGLGRAFLDIAKEQARRERRRAIILETQSCNVNAVDFYLHEGFTLIGFDACCYKNNDLDRKEVRLELGWFPQEKVRLSREELEIRPETEADHYAAEEMTRRAFFNKHHLGCDEHYLVYKLRGDKDYLPELSRLAVKDGTVIGAIYYSKARVESAAGAREVLTFGPLCVAPEWQGCGVGELLLRETMAMAAKMRYKGIVIYGEPDYYPRIGFKTCDHFCITTPEGKNFDAFMGIELCAGGMKGIEGKFYESDAFTDLPKDEAEAYDKKFSPIKKMRFPGQWD